MYSYALKRGGVGRKNKFLYLIALEREGSNSLLIYPQLAQFFSRHELLFLGIAQPSQNSTNESNTGVIGLIKYLNKKSAIGVL